MAGDPDCSMKLSLEKANECINETVRLSFYADFLYPLASGSTLNDYYLETPEGKFSEALTKCRSALWDKLHGYQMKLIRMAPAAFIHLGTTKELLQLVVENMPSFRFLGWSENVLSNVSDTHYASSNTYVSSTAVIGVGAYLEDSNILSGSIVGKGCIISNCTLEGACIDDHTVLHGVKLHDGRFCVRMYGVDDNPKEAKWFGNEISGPLWTVPVHPVRDSMREAVNAALCHSTNGTLMSLHESFAQADAAAIIHWQQRMTDKVKAYSLMEAIARRDYIEEVHKNIFSAGINGCVAERLHKWAETASFSERMRIYFYLSQLMNGKGKRALLNQCFDTLRNVILELALTGAAYNDNLMIRKNKSIVRLPIRVNFGGGWSDTPPYCNEHGGTVLNAAVLLDGEKPVEASFEKVEQMAIILSSTDNGALRTFEHIDDLRNCQDPNDAFALHKAVLIACGVIPYAGKNDLKDILLRLGGGFKVNTHVYNIPRGSGLGTSSILAGACVKAAYEFFGKTIEGNDLYNRVLCAEQTMATGGGWQDQVGGLVPGIKMVRSGPGIMQYITCETLKLSDNISNRC